MYKILVFGMTENPGGVESVIMNYYHYMDKNTFHFDFLCNLLTPPFVLGGVFFIILF